MLEKATTTTSDRCAQETTTTRRQKVDDDNIRRPRRLRCRPVTTTARLETSTTTTLRRRCASNTTQYYSCDVRLKTTVVDPTSRIQPRNIHATDALKAKFHYAILVADRSEAGRRPVTDLLARASSLLAS